MGEKKKKRKEKKRRKRNAKLLADSAEVGHRENP